MLKISYLKILFICICLVLAVYPLSAKQLDLFAKDSTVKIKISGFSGIESFLPLRVSNVNSSKIFFFYNPNTGSAKDTIKEIFVHFAEALDSIYLEKFSEYKEMKIKDTLRISFYEDKIKKTVSEKGQAIREVSNVVGFVGLGILALPITSYFSREGKKNLDVSLEPPAREFDLSKGVLIQRNKNNIQTELIIKEEKKLNSKKSLDKGIKGVIAVGIASIFVYTIYIIATGL